MKTTSWEEVGPTFFFVLAAVTAMPSVAGIYVSFLLFTSQSYVMGIALGLPALMGVILSASLLARGRERRKKNSQCKRHGISL
jgi:hypothetical protein